MRVVHALGYRCCMETTQAHVERAFQEWCAILDVNPLSKTNPGSFRLVVDESGRVHIDQVIGDGGEVRSVTAPMTGPEFCAAVRFAHETMNLKTVQVARAIAKRRRR